VTGEGQGRSEQTTRPSASGTIRPAAPAASKRAGRITIWVFAEWSLISAVRRWRRRPRVSTATYRDCGRWWTTARSHPGRSRTAGCPDQPHDPRRHRPGHPRCPGSGGWRGRLNRDIGPGGRGDCQPFDPRAVGRSPLLRPRPWWTGDQCAEPHL